MHVEDFIETDYTYHYDALTPEMPHVILFRGRVFARARAHCGELTVFRGDAEVTFASVPCCGGVSNAESEREAPYIFAAMLGVAYADWNARRYVSRVLA